jgi:hypothetical protein
MKLRCGSSSRTPLLQAPEFKPQFLKKRKKERKKKRKELPERMKSQVRVESLT